MESGKPDSKKKRRKYYRKICCLCQKAVLLFEEELLKVTDNVKTADIVPTKQAQLCRLVKMINEDVESVIKVMAYCKRRIFNDETVPSKEKIMSISDPDAAYIQKGNREASIGYKPQLGRSKNGFISSVIIPKGNLSDSSQFKPIVEQGINRTHIIPDVISVDDGYVHTSERMALLKRGVKVVSFSGSKGKRLIPQQDWDSLSYQEARNDRSAVESLMFTIKHKFDFDRVLRRGHSNVEAELLEKILAYNFCRILQIREHQKTPLQLAA